MNELEEESCIAGPMTPSESPETINANSTVQPTNCRRAPPILTKSLKDLPTVCRPSSSCWNCASDKELASSASAPC